MGEACPLGASPALTQPSWQRPALCFTFAQKGPSGLSGGQTLRDSAVNGQDSAMELAPSALRSSGAAKGLERSLQFPRGSQAPPMSPMRQELLDCSAALRTVGTAKRFPLCFCADCCLGRSATNAALLWGGLPRGEVLRS